MLQRQKPVISRSASWRIVFLVLTFVFMGWPLLSFADCDRWFVKTGVLAGTEDCETECSAQLTDMGTIECPLLCRDLCKTVLPVRLAQYVPVKGLLPAEKSLIAKFPKEALLIYKAKLKAEFATDRLFGVGRRNDESDAFRHFIWAGNSVREVGRDKARLFLEAHEENSKQPPSEKAMDLANNEAGIAAAGRLQGEKSFQEKLEKEGLKMLKDGKLKVIKPRGEVPEWKKY